MPYKAFDGVVDALTPLPAAGCRTRTRPSAAAARRRAAAARVPGAPPASRPWRAAPRPRRDDHGSAGAARGAPSRRCASSCSRLAERRPLVLAIDDLQWADADSAGLLASSCARPTRRRSCCWLPPRPTGAAPARSAPTADRRTRRSSYAGRPARAASGPSTPTRPRELATLLLGTQRPAGRSTRPAIAAEAAGHPLFIDELVRYAGGGRAARRRRCASTTRSRPASRAPRRRRATLLELVVRGRRRRCPRRDRPRAAALERRAVRHATCWRAAARPPGPHRAARAAPTRRAVPRPRARGGGRPVLDGRLRVATTRAWPCARGRRAAATRAAAASTSRRPARPSAPPSYAEARPRARRAALAFDRAAELYRAAPGWGTAPATAPWICGIALGDALANAGRAPRPPPQFALAAEGADPATRLECRRQAAEQLLISGHIERRPRRDGRGCWPRWGRGCRDSRGARCVAAVAPRAAAPARAGLAPPPRKAGSAASS